MLAQDGNDKGESPRSGSGSSTPSSSSVHSPSSGGWFSHDPEPRWQSNIPTIQMAAR